MAEAYHVRPSVLLDVVDNSYLAFCIDRAVWMFGTTVETDMEDAQDDPNLGKTPTKEQMFQARLRVFHEYMGVTDGKPDIPKGRFADPMVDIKAGQTRR